MYTYKFVDISHSTWTGKPKESIEGIIEEHASLGWRFVEIYSTLKSSGSRKVSKVIFEKEVNDDFYSRKSDLPFIDDEGFV